MRSGTKVTQRLGPPCEGLTKRGRPCRRPNARLILDRWLCSHHAQERFDAYRAAQEASGRWRR